MTTRSLRLVHAIDLRMLPMTSTVMWQSQGCVVVGSKLHRCADGRQGLLIRWRVHCPACDAPFEIMPPVQVCMAGRRCPEHHRAGGAVSNRDRKQRRRFLARGGRRKANADSVR